MRSSDMPSKPKEAAAEQRRAGNKPQRTAGPSYRPEIETPAPKQADLLAIVRVVDIYSLGQRLVQQGYDLYDGIEYPSYAERLRATILGNGIACVLCGPNLAGKLEDYGQAFERVTGELLAPKRARKDVPRGAHITQHVDSQSNTP